MASIIAGAVAIAALGWAVYTHYAANTVAPKTQELTTPFNPLTNFVIPSCDKVKTTDLRGAYDLARDLPTQSARDSAYVALVRDAMCLEQYALAEQLVHRIVDPSSRDSAARIGTEFLLQAKRYEDAQRWASFLSDPRDKEWFMKRIFDAARTAS